LTGLLACLGTGCLSFSRLKPQPFSAPLNHRLIAGVPFYPDETYLCGPASLAAVMTFQGVPVTVEEARQAVVRPSLRGSLAADLVLTARKNGLKSSFWSARPEEILIHINQQKPVILQINSGLAYRTGHFIVAVGYGPEGLVANSGAMQQTIIPWADFLTKWLAFNNLAILIEKPDDPSRPAETIVPPAPILTLDQPQ
jgi:hypothetical protein